MLYFECWNTDDEEIRKKIRIEYENLCSLRSPYYNIEIVKLNKKYRGVFSIPNKKTKRIEEFAKIIEDSGIRGGFQEIEICSPKKKIWYTISISETWNTRLKKEDLILAENLRKAMILSKFFGKDSDSFIRCFGNRHESKRKMEILHLP